MLGVVGPSLLLAAAVVDGPAVAAQPQTAEPVAPAANVTQTQAAVEAAPTALPTERAALALTATMPKLTMCASLSQPSMASTSTDWPVSTNTMKHGE